MPKSHSGSCHCGFVKFEVTAEIDHVRECNCSVCQKRGTLNFRVADDALKHITPLSEVVLYQWGSKTAEDYFCPKCGILPFRRPSQLTKAEIEAGMKPFNGWAINVRCIDGIDLNALPVVKVNGAAL